jgi:glycosyltransferase involved in cell wall biosynthesis
VPPAVKVAHLTTVDMSLRFLVLAQLRAARDRGWEAIGISADGPWVADLEREGIRHIALASSTRAMSPIADLRSALELWRVLRRERIDVLHTHNPKPGFYGRIVGRLAGVPIVVNTVHGLYATETDPWPKRALVYALEALAARFSHAELYQNAEDLDRMRRWHLTRRARLLGNGIDLERFDAAAVPTARREVRAELGIGDDIIVVGTVGRLVAEKGYPELFDAMAELDAGRYRLVAVGADDPDKPDALPRDLLDRARSRGARLLGPRADVERLYPAMDVFVLASHREGFPRVVMEAAAMGLPVVATDIRGCRQAVDPGRSGVLVPVGDARALAGAIRSLGEDAGARERMARAGIELARARFDERRVVEMVLRAYAEGAADRGFSLDTGRGWREDHSE